MTTKECAHRHEPYNPAIHKRCPECVFIENLWDRENEQRAQLILDFERIFHSLRDPNGNPEGAWRQANKTWEQHRERLKELQRYTCPQSEPQPVAKED